METTPVTSRHLHNFSLPPWDHKNQMNATNRFRSDSELTAVAVRDSPPLQAAAENRHSAPCSDGNGGSKNEPDLKNHFTNRKLVIVSRSLQRNRLSIVVRSSQKQQSAVLERENNEADEEREKEKEKVKVVDEVVEAEDSMARPWNLRRRKANSKVSENLKNGELRETVSSVPPENFAKSSRLRGVADGRFSEKRTSWIALSRKEIEEDLFAMTGLNPARRRKMSPKAVENQINNLFPGSKLARITAESYRVE